MALPIYTEIISPGSSCKIKMVGFGNGFLYGFCTGSIDQSKD